MSAASFLALGDSYSIGEGVPLKGGWPARLAARLREGGVPLSDPHIVATTGWSTDELAAGMHAATFDPPYALVTLLIGVNNQYRGRSLDNYREEYADVLNRAIALTGGDASHVLGISIPDWGVTRFARQENRNAARIAAELDAFNHAAQGMLEAAGGHWADITPVSRHCGAAADMLADDGLHPSALQYAIWLEHIEPAAKAIVSAHTL